MTASSEKDTKTLLIERIGQTLERLDTALDEVFEKPSDVAYLADEAREENYFENHPTYPGRNHFVRSLPGGLELWFRIEFDDQPFAGFSVYDAEGHGLKLFQDMPAELKDSLYAEFNTCEAEVAQNCWWLTKTFLPAGNKDESPNFYQQDQRALQLLDAEAFEAFLTQSSVHLTRHSQDL